MAGRDKNISMKIAVIIKNPYRDYDWRVDIIDVDEDADMAKIRTIIEREMLGPFEILAMTSRINFDRNIDINKLNETENHTP